MRTTLTLDDDVANYLKEQCRLLEKPFKQVVNDTLRQGMSHAAGSTKHRRFKVRPFSSGFLPGVDPDNPKRYLDELEVVEFLRKNPDW